MKIEDVISPQERLLIVDYIVNILLTQTPKQALPALHHNEDWFYITEAGKVGLNLRHKAYVAELLVGKYVKEAKPSWKTDYQKLGTVYSNYFYVLMQSVMSRREIREHKSRLLQKQKGHVVKLHKERLKKVKNEIADLHKRQKEIEAEIDRLTKSP